MITISRVRCAHAPCTAGKMALPFRLSLLCRRSGKLNLNPSWPKRVSHNATPTPSILHRVVNTVRNDPFIKLSLSLCVLVGGGTLIIELYNKWKKTIAPKVLMLPSEFAHHSINRQSLVSHLRKELQNLRSRCESVPPLLYISGPPGCGKTELVRQFCKDTSVSKKWLGLKSLPPMVLCVDATSPVLLQSSLAEAASCLGVHPASNIEELFSGVLTKLSASQLPWFLIVDNLTRDTASLFEALVNKLKNSSYHQQGAMLITTQCPPERGTHWSIFEMSRYDIGRIWEGRPAFP